MKKFKTAILSTLAMMAIGGPSARASDIDIFGGIAGQGGPKPNIIILIDNASRNNSSWPSTCAANSALSGSKLFNSVTCALYTAVAQINATQPNGQPNPLLGSFNLGLMVYGGGSNKGGDWIIPSTPPLSTGLPTMDAQGISNFQARIVNPGLGTSNNAAASTVMQESWAFFTGHQGLSGNNYSAHLGSGAAAACQKSFLIFIGAAAKNGTPETGNGDAGGASGLASAGATAAQQVQINTSYIGSDRGDEGAWIDEWARFLNQTDFNNNQNDKQNIVTYTIAAGGNDPDYVQVLQSAADAGGGKSFVGADVDSMVQALLKIFNEVQAVNSVFASSSLPVSVNAQGTFQNQIYIGMFRPDASAGPRWLGNLKQYKFAVGGNAASPTLYLADSLGNAALSSAGTGFISPNAVSYWTKKDTSVLPDSTGGYWVNTPASAGGGFDSPDGELVEKGGVGQQLRLTNLTDNYTTNPHSPRKLYTCITSCAAGSSLSASNFATDNSNITTAMLGITGNSSSVSTVTRSGTTVTMTLAAAPSPALTNGQSVTINGASNIELNGTFTIAVVNSTTFTYTIGESPPSPSTGTYTASLPSTQLTITSLTRSGTTVTAVTSAAHGYATGNNITISGANEAEYNGTYAITVVNTTSFRYTIADNPTAPSTGGSAVVSPGGAANTVSFTVGQISRDTTATNNTSIVTVLVNNDLPSSYITNAQVTITGVSPSGYNVTNLALLFGGGNSQGSSCPGISNGNRKKAFCYSITTTPAATATGAPKADKTLFANVSQITHTQSCTGGSPSPNVTVTVTTTASHPFTTGQTITIAGTPGARESAYLGSFTITKQTNTTFTYNNQITTTPPCSPSASGIQVITSASSINRDSLINWVRGQDNTNDEVGPGGTITVRPSIHGDVLHSRPTVVNYGGSIGAVVFYGSNDGVYRAINGNQPLAGGATIGGTAPGGEIWGFIPQEFFTSLKRLYLNSPAIQLATTPAGINPTPAPKDYFFDGGTGVWQNTSTTPQTVYIYPSARRGGRFIYGLNVSDPADPKFMWKRSSTDSGFGELGYTWSTPKVAKVKGYTNPVVIFGGGYDTNQDNDPPTSADTMGRGIFIVDATNGNIVWQAVYSSGGGAGSCTGTPCQLSDMLYSIPSDIALLNRDFDQNGYIDRLYVGDTGGNIWRVDLEPNQSNTAPSTWKVTKFASLGGTGSPKRKFFYPPDVVATKNFEMVLAVTGDREHPLYSAATNSAYTVVNRFYGIKDTKVGFDAGTVATITDSSASTSNSGASTMTDATSTPYNPGTANDGFFIRLTNAGEKGVNAPTTVGGYTYFGTNQPPTPNANACNNLGIARGYQVNFITGSAGYVTFDGGGLPPSPVAGLVNVTDAQGNNLTVPFCLGCGNPGPSCSGPDCKSSLGGGKPPIPVPPVRKRLYWYLDKHDN